MRITKRTKGVARWAIFLWAFVLMAAAFLWHGLSEQYLLVTNSERPDALKVLFIGNSFTFSNEMPTMLYRLLEAGTPGRPLKIAQVAYPSLTLEQQWKMGIALGAIQKHGPWDYVILQEQSCGPLQNPDSFVRYGTLFDEEIRKAGAHTVLLMTWADRDRSEDQRFLTERYEELGRKLQCIVAPAGSVWARTLTQFPGLSLYQSDNHHPSPLGSYLVSCTVYGALTRSNPESLPETLTVLNDQNNHPLVTLTKREARQIQSIVWQTISGHP